MDLKKKKHFLGESEALKSLVTDYAGTQKNVNQNIYPVMFNVLLLYGLEKSKYEWLPFSENS